MEGAQARIEVGVADPHQPVFAIDHDIQNQSEDNLSKYAAEGPLITQVEGAAYGAFGDGLHAAFYLSAALVIVAGVLAAFTLGKRSSKKDTPQEAAAEV